MRKKLTSQCTSPTLSLSDCIYSFNLEIERLSEQIGQLEKKSQDDEMYEIYKSTALQYIGQMVAYKRVIQILEKDLDISK